MASIPDKQVIRDTRLSVDECPFRVTLSSSDPDTAQCLFLERTFQVDERAFSTVSRKACEACSRTEFPSPEMFNSVIASFVNAGARRIIDRNGIPGCDVERARVLRDFAVSELVRTTLKTGKVQEKDSPAVGGRLRLHSCDVIVCCVDPSERTISAIQSAACQEGVRTHIHLIDDGCGAVTGAHFDDPELFQTHRNETPLGPFLSLVKILPQLRSRYIAIQDPRTYSRRDRLRHLIELLEQTGGELGAAVVRLADGVLLPQDPESLSSWPSLVIRRATLLDMLRIHGSALDSCGGLINVAQCEKRRVSFSRRVGLDSPSQSGELLEPNSRKTASRSSPVHHSQSRPAVDVVLPFYNTIEFVTESLASVLNQTGVDVVVHLIDDASTVDTAVFLDEWGRDSRVRLYRNSRNAGPYISFNNVSRFFETDYVAIQDADDLSLPHRLSISLASLYESHADIFAAGMEMFGDSCERRSTTGITESNPHFRSVTRLRYSRYPSLAGGHYLFNGTVVMRTRTFFELGGFADYGEIHLNRCGLDSEFYQRAYFAGCQIFISREIVLKCRRHAESMTQNNQTGWGTQPRQFARKKQQERLRLYQEQAFDPRDFGGLARYTALTERVN